MHPSRTKPDPAAPKGGGFDRKGNTMNKTLKRRVFRHTALYAAILMFSHTGGGGGADGANP
ncbi:pilC2 protein [Neisseria meningitidis H44/76]|uniref:PilC2 protein n=1 Tax=Neisseria meningitidis serogroup B / serotype 15 (strain H44/76) TaxID=909420 RepID=E6MYL3_NEIMH|nr:pilC2 protein [Neisseria meningitidis H44/76]